MWALLGDRTVLELLSYKETARAIVRDCIVVSQAYPLPDEEPPVGGFAASEVFSGEWRHSGVLRVEHEKAMRGLYYGVPRRRSMWCSIGWMSIAVCLT